MNRLILTIVACLCTCWLLETAAAQSPILRSPNQNAGNQLRRDRLRGSLNSLNNGIGEQRVQRQTEVLRLEELLRSAEERITRLERKVLFSASAPSMTLPEAEATLAFAKAQLKESETLHRDGKVSDVTLARHRLENVRAQGQLETTVYAHADRLIALEIEVLYAERDFSELTQLHERIERFVAKGYTSSEGLKRSEYDLGLAQKRVELARLRLAAQKQATDFRDPAKLIKELGSKSVAVGGGQGTTQENKETQESQESQPPGSVNTQTQQ